MQLAGAVLGGFLGAPVAAGIAAYVSQFGKGCCRKAKLGPLPLSGYAKYLATLHAVYLGENPLRRPGSGTTGTRRPDSSEPAMAIILDPDEERTSEPPMAVLRTRTKFR